MSTSTDNTSDVGPEEEVTLKVFLNLAGEVDSKSTLYYPEPEERKLRAGGMEQPCILHDQATGRLRWFDWTSTIMEPARSVCFDAEGFAISEEAGDTQTAGAWVLV